MAAAAWSTAPWHAKAHAAREALVDDIVRLLPPQPSGKPAKRPTDPGHDERWGRPKPVEDQRWRARAVRLRASAGGNCAAHGARAAGHRRRQGVSAKDDRTIARRRGRLLALQAALALNPARRRCQHGGGAARTAEAGAPYPRCPAAAAAAAAAPSSPSPPSSPDTSARPSSSALRTHRSSHRSSSPSSSPTALAARGRGALARRVCAATDDPNEFEGARPPSALRQTLPMASPSVRRGTSRRRRSRLTGAATRATSGGSAEVCRVDLETPPPPSFERLVQE